MRRKVLSALHPHVNNYYFYIIINYFIYLLYQFCVNIGKKEEKRPPLVQYMMEGDFFIGASLATTLSKLALRYKLLESNIQKSNKLQAEAMFIMSSVLQLGRSGLPVKAMTHDDAERISLCLRSLACPTTIIQKVFTEGCRDALSKMLFAKAEEDSQNQKVVIKIGDIK